MTHNIKVSLEMDDNPTHAIDLEEEMTKVLADEISQEIDFGIIAEIMIQQGWHKVQLSPFKNNNHAVDIKYWVEEHCHYDHMNHGTTFIFEDQGDAVNFTMKWAT